MSKPKLWLILICCLIVGQGIFGLSDDTVEKADSLLQQGYIKSSLQQAIALYEQVLQSNPDNRRVLNKLSEAYYKLGYIHLYVFAEHPNSLQQKRAQYYKKGLQYGMRSLNLNSSFRDKKDNNFRAALKEINDIAALHWTSCNWGKILEQSGISFRALTELPKLKATLQRAVQVNKSYLCGGPLRAMASYWAGLPWWKGRNLKKAKQLFKESIGICPNFSGNRALYVREYIARKENCKLLSRQVSIIRETPLSQNHKIWDLAAKAGTKKFLKTMEWCNLK